MAEQNEISGAARLVKLQCVGGGRMGEALVRGLVEAGWATEAELAVVEVVEARRRQLSELYPELAVRESALDGVDAVLAVKPIDVAEVAGGLRCPRVLSIVAGVRLRSLEEWLGDGCRVIRAMPNTPALVGLGAAAFAPGRLAQQHDLDWAEQILQAVGSAVQVEEELLDAVTAVSGSGPAYLFLVAEAMLDAARQVGLPEEVADELVRQTLLGSARLLRDGEDPAQLRQNVTSPGGTTAAALEVFENRELRQIFTDAIQAATDRSVELGS